MVHLKREYENTLTFSEMNRHVPFSLMMLLTEAVSIIFACVSYYSFLFLELMRCPDDMFVIPFDSMKENENSFEFVLNNFTSCRRFS